MLHDAVIRFLIGGVIVSAFAILGNLFKPKMFAGLFGAAPSVAIATLTLTAAKNGPSYASTEARSMLAGAIALCFYSICVAFLLLRYRLPALTATLSSTAAWFCAAFGLWFVFLR
jgi:uncharacterized membrane protein (GlpM family)